MTTPNKQKTLAAVKPAAGKRFAKVQRMADTLWKPDRTERNAVLDATLRHAAGLSSAMPDLDELRYELDWVLSFVGDDPSAWDDWDKRLAVAIASSKECRTCWEIGSWARDIVDKASPKAEVFGPLAGALCAKGMKPAELAAVCLSRGTPLAKKGAPTSFGRWAKPLLDAKLNEVLSAAVRLDILADVLENVLEQDPRALLSRLGKLALPANAMGALAAALLAHDAKAYAKDAAALLATCKDPVPLLDAARALAETGDRAGALALGVRAASLVRGKDFDVDHESFTRAKQLLDVLGEPGLAVFRAMPQTDGILWKGLLEDAAGALGKKAWPYIVEQMTIAANKKGEARADPFNLGFHLLGRAGVKAHLAELAPLREHRDAWVRERATAELAEYTAKPEKPRDPFAGRRMPPKRRAFDPKDGYALETFAAETARLCLAEILRERKSVPVPVETLRYEWMDGDLRVRAVTLSNGDDSVTIEVPSPKKSRVPDHIDDADGKRSPLAQLFTLIGVDPEAAFEKLSWGDSWELPGAAHYYELLVAGGDILAGLAKAGIEVTKKPSITIADESEAPKVYAAKARASLKKLPKDLRADVAALCYATPARRKWLLG